MYAYKYADMCAYIHIVYIKFYICFKKGFVINRYIEK